MIELDRFSFTYSGASKPVLDDISIQINEGDFVVVVGLSGCGKSTFCRAINGLVPHFYGGKVSGRVRVDGLDTRTTPPAKMARTVGMVFQDPENQLVMTNVENEMAFGMENLALPKDEMEARVRQYSGYFDLERFFKRFIPELSGGEKQKVALASVLAMRPKYIVLDEPTSQLDEEAASMFLGFLEKINRDQGVTVILVEHRLERCLRFAKRIVVMKDGRVERDGAPQEVVPHLQAMGLLARIKEGEKTGTSGEVVISAQDISFSYDQAKVLDELDMEVRKQEVLAIIGANGSGKSTLLKQLNGILKPSKGKVALMGQDISGATTARLARDIGYLGQNPNNYLFEETLEKELEFTLRNLKVDKAEWDERITWALGVLNLERYRKTFPRDLSCGERERAALASIIVGRPKLLILDEPTRGLDYWNKAKLASIIASLREQGMTTILVTHDYRFVAEYATRVLSLEGGALRGVNVGEVVDLAKRAEDLVA